MNEIIAWMLAVFCVAWGVQAILAVVAQHKLADRTGKPQTDRFACYRPPAVLIVPFKGIEPALRDNLKSLFTQDYLNYELLLIVEDEQDPAYPLLVEAIGQHPERDAEILTAGKANDNEGQKVHNLIAAVEHLRERNGYEEVWVFADSDAVPGPRWLGELVGPLWQDRTAVTTGFRWLIPTAAPESDPASHPASHPGHKVNLAAKIASILNSSTTGFIRRDNFTHAWGGSMAMRVSTAHNADLTGRWQGAISDDYQVTRMCRDLGKRVYFVPECLVASPVDYNWAQLCNFAYRQYVITRIHVPFVFLAAILINALYLLGLASAMTLLFTQPNDHVAQIATGALITVFIANQIRASYRRHVVRLTLGPDVVNQLKPTFLLERWTTPIWMGINLLLLIRAAFGRVITWRGIRYRIDGPQQIQRL